MDIYRPIALANALYKLWTTCIVMLDCWPHSTSEAKKISALSRRASRRTAPDPEPSPTWDYVLKTPTHKKDIVLCYLDFKGAFPSAGHKQLVRNLTFLGLPRNFITIISNLYNEVTAEYITPHGHASPIGICRGTLQGDPLSPILFDLMIEPLIRWLIASHRGYNITLCGLQLDIKW